jgi:uncharacterized protein YijF (DUF1287 family)
MRSQTKTKIIQAFFLLFFSIAFAACDKKQPREQDEANAPRSEKIIAESPPLPPPEPSEPLTFYDKLSQAALERTLHPVIYDPSYVEIPYPWGDVPADKGVCTDVIIRSYRSLGIDLQQAVHKDIKSNFRRYPSQKLWGHKAPDTNIDHRRVPNLQTFFERKGQSLPITDRAEDYSPGDIVSWKLPKDLTHIGIVIEQRAPSGRHMIVHNIGRGSEIEDILFAFEITGHYRYLPDQNDI